MGHAAAPPYWPSPTTTRPIHAPHPLSHTHTRTRKRSQNTHAHTPGLRPRCDYYEICAASQVGLGGKTQVDAWVEEMAAHVKGLGAQQLVTVGLDGFYLHPPGGEEDEGVWGGEGGW